jgi:hypothetical protein
MESPYPEFVSQAAQIASSGRWEAVNKRIEMLCASPGTDNSWWVELLASLCSEVFSEYLALKGAHDGHDVPLLAWRARNLLELSVWSLYCTKSKRMPVASTRTLDATPTALLMPSSDGVPQVGSRPNGWILSGLGNMIFPAGRVSYVA